MGRRSDALYPIAVSAIALAFVFAAEQAVCAEQSASLATIKAEISLHDFDAAAAALAPLAAEGNPQAEYLLGVFYLEGLDGPADTGLARHWLEKAAAQNHARAAATLATLLAQSTPPDVEASQRWRARARALGYRPQQQTAANPLAGMPAQQSTGLEEQALWRAAERGDLAAARA
ncbi:MAG: SEL1-like repeat protein, partial [Gammaproteobacteria bacterium]|nr:SEL1-like repeat protein [Gammaproteobacteria bacterium]